MTAAYRQTQAVYQIGIKRGKYQQMPTSSKPAGQPTSNPPVLVRPICLIYPLWLKVASKALLAFKFLEGIRACLKPR